jgi:NAD(P)-dependent dehydrogenase (short-subunit alcohol dehydrogenase family)
MTEDAQKGPADPSSGLEGRVALITGGGTGLGLAIARELAARGCTLALASRNAEHLASGAERLSGTGARVRTYPLDVRDVHAVRRTVKRIEDELGPVRVLVNNAAGNFVRPAEALPEKAFSAVVDIVLNGTFNVSRSVGRAMIARGGDGVILNIVATYAWTGGPVTVHSDCAKAGVLEMTRTLAVEWARHGIRVVAIAPGPFDSTGAGDRLWPSDELRERVRSGIPLGRFAERDEVARAAVWLVSDEAAYVTGECLTLDGGGWLGRGILGADGAIPRVRRRRRD